MIYKYIDWDFPISYDKYDTNCCKRYFYLLIYNELYCIDLGNQLLIITNTIKYNYNPAAIEFQCYLLQCVINCKKVEFDINW